MDIYQLLFLPTWRDLVDHAKVSDSDSLLLEAPVDANCSREPGSAIVSHPAHSPAYCSVTNYCASLRGPKYSRVGYD